MTLPSLGANSQSPTKRWRLVCPLKPHSHWLIALRSGGLHKRIARGEKRRPSTVTQSGSQPQNFRVNPNLKLLAYYLQFKQRMSMMPVVNQITLANIRSLHHQRDQEEDHTDLDAPTIDGEDWPKIIETLQEYLGACLGTNKLPLAYVVRRDIDPTPPPVGGWPSNKAHMSARAPIVTNPGGPVPIYTVPFQANNKQVWLKLASICRDKDCWTYIRRYQSTQNGHAAFWALHDHYLGASNVDNMSAHAERKLMDTVYNGEKCRWNFEKYVRLHVKQHAVLEDLVQYGYSGIDEGSKVRYHVRTQALDTVKANILASAALRNNFTAASTLFKDFIDQTKSSQPDQDITVAGIGTEGDDDDSDSAPTTGTGTILRAKPDMSVDERYYSQQEYRSLSPEKKVGLIAKREARDTRGGGRDRNCGRNMRPGRMQQVTLSKASIAAVAAAMKGGEDIDDGNNGADDGDSNSGEEQVPMEPLAKRQKIMNNCNNPALQRRTSRCDQPKPGDLRQYRRSA
jgi:hypothetical protein